MNKISNRLVLIFFSFTLLAYAQTSAKETRGYGFEQNPNFKRTAGTTQETPKNQPVNTSPTKVQNVQPAAAAPGNQPAAAPGSQPAAAPGTQPAAAPGTQPAHAPGKEPAKDPCAKEPAKEPPKEQPAGVGISFGFDYLWWKTCAKDLDTGYVVRRETTPEKDTRKYRYKKIEPDWAPGYRAFLSKTKFWDTSLTLKASYTYLKSRERRIYSRPIGGGNVYSTLTDDLTAERVGNTIDTITGRWQAIYQTFDFLFALPLQTCQGRHLTPYVGFDSLFLDQTFSSHGGFINPNRNTFDTHWTSEVWALGIKIGTTYDYPLCNGFKLFGNGCGMILAGLARNHNVSTFTDNSHVTDSCDIPFRYNDKFYDGKSCYCIPGWHLQVGAAFETKLMNFGAYFRLGYEFVEWYNVPNPRRFFYSNNEDAFNGRSTQPITSSLGFNGLFFGFGLMF